MTISNQYCYTQHQWKICQSNDQSTYLAYLPQLSISIQYCFCKWIIQNTQSNKESFNVTIKARISQLRGHTSPNYDQPTSPLSQRSIARRLFARPTIFTEHYWRSHSALSFGFIAFYGIAYFTRIPLITFKAADALLVVTVYRLWSNPSIHPSIHP